jgi:DNA-directed RNA polymerase sigma subunit (sigma70/sigma32)
MHGPVTSDFDGLNLSDLVSMASEQPVLDNANEDALIRRAGEGDAVALEQLVLGNLRIAIDEAIRTRGLGRPQRELVREGVSILVESARSYDPILHGRFSSHVRTRVRRAIRERTSFS